MGGLILPLVQFGVEPGIAARLTTAEVGQLAEDLQATADEAQDTDRMKMRGLYVDLDASGTIRRPDDLSAADARHLIVRAKQVAESAWMLRDPAVLAGLADPPAEYLALSSEVFRQYMGSPVATGSEGAARKVIDSASFALANLPVLPEEP